MAGEVTVHELSSDPTSAWEKMRSDATVIRFKVKTPKEPIPTDKLRVVCLSDTHSLTASMRHKVPSGDVLVHAGDFTKCGHVSDVRNFNEWLGSLPHKHKIVIAGNHELILDETYISTRNGVVDLKPEPEGHRSSHTGTPIGMTSPRMVPRDPSFLMSKLGLIDSDMVDAEEEEKKCNSATVRNVLSNCIYLQDSSVTLYGIKFYGTPWQPEFRGWGFNLARGQKLLDKWELVPDDTAVLITHTPPIGYGDLCCTGVRAGCVELLNIVQKRIRPKYHVYGHIHEGYGVRSDGRTIFINASICDIGFRPNNRPIVFDIALPSGHTKGEP